MTNTELIKFIINELKNEGLSWESQQEIFEILAPDQSWEKNERNWNNWKQGIVDNLTKSPHILTAIQNTLGFDSSVWISSDSKQKKEIKKVVQVFLASKRTIDLSTLMPSENPASQVQREVIESINALSSDALMCAIDKHPAFFEPSFENQSFLLELLSLLYDKGEYDILDEKIFPSLLSHHKLDENIKILMAHTFGSLTTPKYLEAAMLLNTIKGDPPCQMIDLKTAAISNVRRELLLKPDVARDELRDALKVLREHYNDTYKKTKNFHYYPGINLAYILQLSNILFPDNPEIGTSDVQQIHNESKNSISVESKDASKETRYFALMSGLEFELLLGEESVEAALYLLLENLQPSTDLIMRTLRQMAFFVDILESFSDERADDVKVEFRKVIDILDGYLNSL